MKPHALLITGQLRCVDQNFIALLDSASHIAQMFIVTDQRYAADARILCSRYDGIVCFTEEAAEIEMGVPLSRTHLVHPEFIKLEIALNQMAAWESSNQMTFKYVHRLRSDVIYQGPFEDHISPVLQPEINESSIFFPNWCHNFSGTRSAMLRLLGFPAFCCEYKLSLDAMHGAHKCINIDALRKSSHSNLYGASLPVAVLSSREQIPDFHEKIHLEYSSYIDAADDFSKRIRLEGLPEKIILLHGRMSSFVEPSDFDVCRTFFRQWFPWHPEVLFYLFINLKGMSTHLYSFKSEPMQMPLKYERHATTDFTIDLFRRIQFEDYTLFEGDVNWEERVNEYLAAGGQPGYIIQKFTTIRIKALSNAACSNLFEAIDLVNYASWIMDYAPFFAKEILERGIQPPETLSRLMQVK